MRTAIAWRTDTPDISATRAPSVAAQPVTVPTVTPGLVARAFRTIDLPASELGVQPPDGRTLVNFDTNFYTEQPGFNRTVRLLGQAGGSADLAESVPVGVRRRGGAGERECGGAVPASC